METEFRSDYNAMRKEVEDFATSLLDHARTSYELMIILNHDHENPTWVSGRHQPLDRLKLAIKYKQKKFVAHPNVQQLLAAIWYDGLPGFRRKNLVGQLIHVVKIAILFPFFSIAYMLTPWSKTGRFMKKPFVKFICHSGSYALFLVFLGAASQRFEVLLLEYFGTDSMKEIVEEWHKKERGANMGFAECGVIIYVLSLIWSEIRSLWCDGLKEYLSDLWNIMDFITNSFYVTWFALRMSSRFITWMEEAQGENPWYPREQWDIFEPILISEGAFAAGMIFSFLKLVHIFSVNPHLGPLQISLGRMIIDIVKFFFIYTLVLFAFGCGLNQLLWYYAELEKNKCYHLPNGLPDFENNDKACTIWRRYANLFETSQSLFWASFGLVDLMSFELTGIKGFTRFWALLMFGSYSVINVIVLLNMLIAMMSNSYQIISERSDVEWKFARSRLWISYFDAGDTLPPPFNILPNIKCIFKIFHCFRKELIDDTNYKERSKQKVKERHNVVVKLLVRRYVTAEQRKRDDFGVTEDDVMEIRQDISTLRYELIEILRNNGMKTPSMTFEDKQICGKRGKILERRILKDFHIGTVTDSTSESNENIFGRIAKMVAKKTSFKLKKTDWNALVRKSRKVNDPIGSTKEAEDYRRNRQSFRKYVMDNVNKPSGLDDAKLLEYNSNLGEISKSARVAYVKFMRKKFASDSDKEKFQIENEKVRGSETETVLANADVETAKSIENVVSVDTHVIDERDEDRMHFEEISKGEGSNSTAKEALKHSWI